MSLPWNTWHESVFASNTHQTRAPWKAWCSATRWRCSTSLWLNAWRAAALRYPAQGCRGGRPGWARWWSHRGCRYGPLHPAGGRIKLWENLQQFHLFSFIQMCIFQSSFPQTASCLNYWFVCLFFLTVSLIMFLFTSVVENFESIVWIHKWKY